MQRAVAGTGTDKDDPDLSQSRPGLGRGSNHFFLDLPDVVPDEEDKTSPQKQQTQAELGTLATFEAWRWHQLMPIRCAIVTVGT